VIAPRRRLLATVGLGLTVGALGVVGLRTARLDGVQNQWEDLLQPGLSGADEVVVVAIDRETLGLTGGWPWPRDLHASLLSGIGAADPAVVLYDVLFADPREGDDALAAAIEQRSTSVTSTSRTCPIPESCSRCRCTCSTAEGSQSHRSCSPPRPSRRGSPAR
jgi:CHASE2 domain-containing sensor protein